jgi:DNA-binding NtrC family response regulator
MLAAGGGADLFGHERGTGSQAVRRRLGSFEFAHRGTIYLDEVGAVPRGLVHTLADVLRTGEVWRAGACDVNRVDVRVIASTAGMESGSRDELWEALRALNAVEIAVPPLRERTDEISLFASFFGEQFGRRYRREPSLCPELIAEFERRSWPGNLRELAVAVHSAIIGPGRSPQTPVDAVSAR